MVLLLNENHYQLENLIGTKSKGHVHYSVFSIFQDKEKRIKIRYSTEKILEQKITIFNKLAKIYFHLKTNQIAVRNFGKILTNK